MKIPEVTPTELAQELAGSQPPKLLDVREDEELEIARLNEDAHVPMAQVPDRIAELDPEADWVVICRSGRRSLHVAEFLLSQGFTRVRNLNGGLLRWSDEVDPSMTQY